MDVLLAIFTLLAAWALLGVVAVGLLLLIKSLQSIRRWLEQIVVGLRAVEHHTASLGRHADALGPSLDAAIASVAGAERALSDVNRDLARRGAEGSASA
jgi:hypothetical protein